MLTEAHLERMGIPTIGARLHLLAAIAQLRKRTFQKKKTMKKPYSFFKTLMNGVYRLYCLPSLKQLLSLSSTCIFFFFFPLKHIASEFSILAIRFLFLRSILHARFVAAMAVSVRSVSALQ